MARLIWNGTASDSTKTPGNYLVESTLVAHASALASGDVIIFNRRSGDFVMDTAGSDWNGIDLAAVYTFEDYAGSIPDWEVDVSNGSSALVQLAGGQFIQLKGHSAGIDAVRLERNVRAGSVQLGGTITFPSIRANAGARGIIAANTPVTDLTNAGGHVVVGPDTTAIAVTNEAGTTIVNGRSGTTNALTLKNGLVVAAQGTPWNTITQDGGRLNQRAKRKGDDLAGTNPTIGTYNANAGEFDPTGAEADFYVATLNENVARWRGTLKAGSVVVRVGTPNRL